MAAATDSEGRDSEQGRLPSAEVSAELVIKGSVIDPIAAEMKIAPVISGWVSAAEVQLVATVDELTRDLGVRSVRIARSRGASVVDAQHVRDAHDELTNLRAAKSALWLTVAGLTGGGAISLGLTLWLSPPPAWQIHAAVAALLLIFTVASLVLARPRRSRP